MSERLRDLMEQASAQAPVVRVREDTWRRARRTRAAEVVVLPALLVALVALGGLSLGSLLAHPQAVIAPAGESAKPALPMHLYSVPDWVEPSDDLAVGQLSMVWSERDRDGVLGVRATDGAYVAVDLPGFESFGLGITNWVQEFALSPDGRMLAYARGTQTRESGPDDGVAVVDLETGEVRTLVPVSGTVVEGLSWDAQGEHIAFHDGIGSDGAPWRSVEVSTGEIRTWPVSSYQPAAMGADGQSLVHADGSSVFRDTPDGARTLVGRAPRLFQPASEASIVDSGSGVVLAGEEIIVLFPEGGGTARRLGSATGQVATAVLGANASVAVAVEAGSGDPHQLQILAVDPSSIELSDRRNLFGDQGVSPPVITVAVATELAVTAPRHFPEPDWPTDPRIVWIAGSVVLLGLIVLIGWRRRRPH